MSMHIIMHLWLINIWRQAADIQLTYEVFISLSIFIVCDSPPSLDPVKFCDIQSNMTFNVEMTVAGG